MPQQTKTFRVFVSSTFTDMKEERWILQKEVFPELEKFCESRGAKFQGVDLRWVVSENLSLNQKTLQTCFNEIARCQKISPKPNFLILLGDKYGWQPVPEIIPEAEMLAIQKILQGEAAKLIKKWYWLDENASPHEFVLQPKGKEYKEYANWEPIERDIRIALREAADRLNFTPAQREKYFDSATHQEITRGALMTPEKGEKPSEHVLAFIRKIDGLTVNASVDGFIDLINGKPDKYSQTRLKNLKTDLSHKLGSNCIDYQTDWKNNQSAMPDDIHVSFKEKVLKFLKDIIEEQIKTVVDKGEIVLETKLHEEFKNRLTEHFQGRKNILKTIQNYINKGSEKKVLSLIGASGSGKSSVMAEAEKLNENKRAVVVYRFIGTTSRSSNIMSLLQSVCGQIAKAYGKDAKTLAREGDEKAWYDMNGLSDILRKCLTLATAEKPIVLFLDSLDQLSDTENAKALYWLPRELPDHARMVVSAISLPELVAKLDATDKVELPVLPEKEAIDILSQWFKSINRTLAPEQHDLVINSFQKTKLPIYLKLAFEKAKHWHNYDEAHHLQEDVAGIINDYFDDLEQEHDKDFVTNVVCYLLCGRYQGLAETEILEILAFDDKYWNLFLEKNPYHKQELIDLKKEVEQEVNGPRGYMKMPISVWSRLFLDLEPFLTERDADGVPIITFFHRQFNEVLRERYHLPNPDHQSK
jgi:hypothetical protein